MYKYFTCPDGKEHQIAKCLTKCRMGNRCLSIATLRMIASERPWTGVPSTTQLLKGTREAYLLIISKDLVMDPKDQMFRILGTKSHGVLEQYCDNVLSEERLTHEGSSGAFDMYDFQDHILWDYKTSGSYKVAQCLGFKMVDVDTGQVYKTGEKKGQPKTRKELTVGTPDTGEWELQLNHYRIMIEAQGFPVKEMNIEAIVRDGGTIAARSRGVTENVYKIPIKRLPDAEVLTYFEVKKHKLLKALEYKKTPEVCTEEERWNDRKCKDYCDVAHKCSHGKIIRGDMSEHLPKAD